jgi:hypothetical protein
VRSVPGSQGEAGDDPAEWREGAGVADLVRLPEGQPGVRTLQDTQHLQPLLPRPDRAAQQLRTVINNKRCTIVHTVC